MMKIVEVCEGHSSAGVIKRYQDEENKNNIIIPFSLFLSIGDIKNNRLKFLEEFCHEINFYKENSLKKLLCNIDESTHVRIWSSKKNADDYLLLLYLCNYLKDKCTNISVIYTSDYNEYACSLNSIDYKEVNELLKYEHKLSESEIDNLSNKWICLVNTNSELRVLENGEILNRKYSDYDNIILNKLTKLGKCKISDLIASLMIDFVINDAGDLIYTYLIDRLIDNNKIKIISKGERHFVDIIESV